MKDALIAIGWFALLMYGAKVSFFRSPEWLLPSIGITALVNFVPTALFLRTVKRKGLQGMRLGFMKGTMVAALAYTLMALFSFFLVAYTLPDTYTRFAGTPVRVDQVLYTTRTGIYSGGCRYEVHAAMLARGSTNLHYCAGAQEFAALGESGVARVYARRSWFGRHVYYVEPQTAAGTR
jgi:hypothetical protein